MHMKTFYFLKAFQILLDRKPFLLIDMESGMICGRFLTSTQNQIW